MEADSNSDFDSDHNEMAAPLSKKSKGASTYKSKFNREWVKKWPFVKEVKGDPHKFLCCTCNRQVSCSHMGVSDVVRHVDSKMHQNNAKSAQFQSTLNFAGQSSSSTTAEKVSLSIISYSYNYNTFQTIRAEVKVSTVLVQHNIPLAFADTLSPLFKDIFPDSDIAKGYASKQTKTACIINGAVAPYFQRKLVNVMKSSPYALSIDGSSDNDLEKVNPLTVRVFDEEMGVVATHFFDMCSSSSSTAEAIFSKMKEALVKHDISWQNCVGIGLDNTSVNMGCNNSIMTRIKAVNPSTSIVGCPCHIVHNIANKAGEAYQQVSMPVSYVFINVHIHRYQVLMWKN